MTLYPCVPKCANWVITDFGYERAANRDVYSKSVASYGLLGGRKSSAYKRKELNMLDVTGPTS